MTLPRDCTHAWQTDSDGDRRCSNCGTKRQPTGYRAFAEQTAMYSNFYTTGNFTTNNLTWGLAVGA